MSVNFDFFTAAPEPLRRSGQQVTRRCGGQLVEPVPGIASHPTSSSEQPQVGAVGGVSHFGRRDVQQGKSGSGGGQAEARVHTGPPRSLTHPYQDGTILGITSSQRSSSYA